MKRRLIRMAAAPLGVALLFAGATSAAAVPDPEGYGGHVAGCAQVTGFDGMHNPGAHEGAAGWHPDHVCPE